jgi:hypothetical protein
MDEYLPIIYREFLRTFTGLSLVITRNSFLFLIRVLMRRRG